MLTRRRFLWGATAVAAGGAGVGAGLSCAPNADANTVPFVALGTQPPGLPARQHAWVRSLARDAEGNPISPRFNRLLFFDVDGTPSPTYARVLAADPVRAGAVGLRAAGHRHLPPVPSARL